MSVLNFGNEPGLKSKISACGPLVRSRRRGAFLGLTRRLHAVQGKPSPTRLGPWPPRFPGPLRHPPRPSPSPVQVWRHFATFFFARCGARASRGQNKGFPRSGRMQGSMGPERCGSGPPNGPFEWPHSRFGRGRYLNSDPPAGCGSKRPFGANLVGGRGLAPEGPPMPRTAWAGPGGCIGAL